MEKKIVKIGVLGCKRGLYVVGCLRHDENVKIVAICDKDEDTLQKAKADYMEKGITDVQAFKDLHDLFTCGIDAVFIATYGNDHVKFVKMALEAGLHVMSEIPAINSIAEAKELKAAVLAHPGQKYMIAENCCYWAFIEAWKQMYEEGKFGEAVYADSEYLHGADFTKFKAEDFPSDHWRSYNPAIKYITHNLGPLLYILDDECETVSCMTPDSIYNPYKHGRETGLAIFKTKKGTVIKILICFGAYVGFDHNFSLYGTRGMIATDNTKSIEDGAYSFAKFSDIPDSLNYKIEIPISMKFKGGAAGGHGGADIKMIRAFIDCIINDTKPPLDVDFAIKISMPGIIANESSMQNGAVLPIPKI